MKKGIIIVSAFFLISQGISYQGYGQSRKNIRNFCPESGEVQGWYSEYEPRVARGEDLFLLIDGGADIYFEYGFRDAVFHSYKTENGNAINLEIYRMSAPESAYGIYTFKTGNTGGPIDSGQDGWIEEYYLNFWKGNFLVTLVGLDREKETLDGLVQFACSIDAKLSDSAERPKVADILPLTGLKQNGITYMKGNLALFNQYVFDSGNIFGISEGIRGDYGDYNIFLLFYNDSKKSLSWYDSAKEALTRNGFFHDMHEEGEILFMKDQHDQQVVIKPFINCIIIFLGNPETDFLPIFETIESRISQ